VGGSEELRIQYRGKPEKVWVLKEGGEMRRGRRMGGAGWWSIAGRRGCAGEIGGGMGGGGRQGTKKRVLGREEWWEGRWERVS